jgi:hypothetical protein
MPSPRIHHYRFAYVALPGAVFGDPAGFLDFMEPPNGVGYLRQLWELVGERVDDPIALDAGSLAVELATIGNRRGAMVTLPPPVAPPEAYFAAVVQTSATVRDAGRYFVLEDTFADDGPQGMLCEWFGDGSRRNLSHQIAPSLSGFIAIVEGELAREASREQAGIAATISQRWRPSDDQPPDAIESLFTTSFRCRPCFFAFYALPSAIFGSPNMLLELRDAGTREGIVEQLWREAASRCGTAGNVPPEPPTVRWLPAWSTLIVAMPQPLAPPEPYYVAVSVLHGGRDGRESTAPAIYTLELASENLNAPPIVARIESDGTHSVLAAARSTDVESFLDAVDSHARGERALFDSDRIDTAAQLTRYAVLHAQLR